MQVKYNSKPPSRELLNEALGYYCPSAPKAKDLDFFLGFKDSKLCIKQLINSLSKRIFLAVAVIEKQLTICYNLVTR